MGELGRGELVKQNENLERKNMELAQDAKKAGKARDIFLAKVSHEIRTPINTIMGLNELILRESQDPSIREYAYDIKNAGELLLSIVGDIIDYTRLDAGNLEIIENSYDIASLVNDSINGSILSVRKKNLELIPDIAKDIPYKLIGDEVHLRQIIYNLISNAIKYTEEGSITLHMESKKYKKDQILLKISVKDTGVGIKENEIPEVFAAFRKLEDFDDNSSGMGLGLAVSNKLVSMMGGKLTVESKFGEGSTFSFEIPQKISEYAPVGDINRIFAQNSESEIRYKEKFVAPLAKILIVDDNAMNLAVAQDLLRPTKVNIDLASSGEECLELVKRKEYHLIFMDHMMPEMDGIETLHAIMEQEGDRYKKVPVIALTANAILGARDMYMKEGFADYLTKPIEPDKIEEILINHLPSDLVYVAEEGDVLPESVETDLPEEKLLEIGINPENGIRFMGGNRILYKKILGDFGGMIEERYEKLSACLAKEDYTSFMISVHALKGNARNIGADDMADLAFELEKASKASDEETVKKLSPKLFEDMNRLKERLADCFPDGVSDDTFAKTGDSTKLKSISPKLWKAKLRVLYQKLDDFDSDGAMLCLEELKGYSVSEEDGKMLRLCEKAIKDFAYDVAMDIVKATL